MQDIFLTTYYGLYFSQQFYTMNCYLSVIYSQLSRCRTSRGSSTGLFYVGPTKVKAYKSFLFTEGSHKQRSLSCRAEWVCFIYLLKYYSCSLVLYAHLSFNNFPSLFPSLYLGVLDAECYLILPLVKDFPACFYLSITGHNTNSSSHFTVQIDMHNLACPSHFSEI